MNSFVAIITVHVLGTALRLNGEDLAATLHFTAGDMALPNAAIAHFVAGVVAVVELVFGDNHDLVAEILLLVVHLLDGGDLDRFVAALVSRVSVGFRCWVLSSGTGVVGVSEAVVVSECVRCEEGSCGCCVVFLYYKK